MQPPLKCCGQSFELAAEGLTLPLKAAFTAVTGPKYRKPILKASSRPDIIVFMPNPIFPTRLKRQMNTWPVLKEKCKQIKIQVGTPPKK
jgi:hypothetical protein